MVLIGADLQKYQIIPLADVQADITKRLIDRQINNDTTIFRNADQMIW
jgi:hypothetical protein